MRWLLPTLRADLWHQAVTYWSAWLVASGARPRTVELRRYQIGHLAEAHLNRSPWSLRSNDLAAWLADQNWSPETRKSYRSALRSFYGWAVAAGETRHNPAANLQPVRTLTPPPRPVPEHVLERALAGANDRDRLILLLAAYAGLRRAEIASLRWADVGAAALRVRGKGGRVRLVPLHPRLATELAGERERRRAGRFGSGYRDRYLEPCGCGCVFPGQSGGTLTAGHVGVVARRALGDGWTAHALRHRFATRAYAGSRDLLAVQALLGHSDPITTKRYTDLSNDSLAAAVAAV